MDLTLALSFLGSFSASCITALSFKFLIYKMGVKIIPIG